MELIPERTIERLSIYRRLLIEEEKNGRTHIYSHDLARLTNNSPAQVRRDIMNIGTSGNPRKGYAVSELITAIGEVLDEKQTTKTCLVGVGNLGKAILAYFKGKRPNLQITAAFDIDPEKTDRVIAGVRCYPVAQIAPIVSRDHITVGILTVPGTAARETADLLIDAGVRSILNFTPTPLHLPPNIFLEEIDITVFLEKAAYFARHAGTNRTLT